MVQFVIWLKGWVSYCEIEVERNPFDNIECEIPKELILTSEQVQVLKETIPLLVKTNLMKSLFMA